MPCTDIALPAGPSEQAEMHVPFWVFPYVLKQAVQTLEGGPEIPIEGILLKQPLHTSLPVLEKGQDAVCPKGELPQRQKRRIHGSLIFLEGLLHSPDQTTDIHKTLLEGFQHFRKMDGGGIQGGLNPGKHRVYALKKLPHPTKELVQAKRVLPGNHGAFREHRSASREKGETVLPYQALGFHHRPCPFPEKFVVQMEVNENRLPSHLQPVNQAPGTPMMVTTPPWFSRVIPLKAAI